MSATVKISAFASCTLMLTMRDKQVKGQQPDSYSQNLSCSESQVSKIVPFCFCRTLLLLILYHLTVMPSHSPLILDPSPSTLSPSPSTLSHSPSTLSPSPSLLSHSPSTLNPSPSALSHSPLTLMKKQIRLLPLRYPQQNWRTLVGACGTNTVAWVLCGCRLPPPPPYILLFVWMY